MSQHPPYVVLPAKTGNAVFCFCDHATNHIPERYDNLGLEEADLMRHIAWDIGAETLTRQFCKTYGAAGLLARFSRLLIDPNRETGSEGIIPPVSDGGSGLITITNLIIKSWSSSLIWSKTIHMTR
jgi:predicted N-formylglutamate amidohydrolase